MQRNKGKATIAVDTFSGDEGTDSNPSATGSIHLKLEKSEFSSERVGTSVIVTSGATVSSTGNVFERNTASSMIQTNSGTITITGTKFENNVVTGGDGVVVVDSYSKVGDTNCVEGTTNIEDNGVTTTTPVSSSRGDAGLCEGTVVMTEGTCRTFGQVCDPNATPTVLSVREVSRESDSTESEIPLSVAAESHVTNDGTGSVDVEAKTTIGRGKSKLLGKSAKQANQRPQQQHSLNARNQDGKSNDKSKKEKSKSSKLRRGSGRKRRRGHRRMLHEVVF